MHRRNLFVAIAGGLGLAACSGGGGDKAAASKDGTAELPLPPVEKSGESELAYAIEVRTDGGADAPNTGMVREDRRFRSGDKFRLIFRPEFAAHVWVVARGPRQSTYQVLFPSERASLKNPIAAGEKVTVPDEDSGWMRMDNQPGEENLVVVASTATLTEFAGMGSTVEREDFEARLAEVERRHRPSSSRRFEDGEWVKLFAARGSGAKGEQLAIVVRLPLLHE